MMKKRIMRFLHYTVIVSFGTLIACVIFAGISILSNGKDLLSANVPYIMLPEILLLGIICAAATELLLGRVIDAETGKTETRIRYALHYVFITLAVLVCGYLFGWYDPCAEKVLWMCFASAAVYAFVYFFSRLSGSITAEKMNEGLKKFKKK